MIKLSGYMNQLNDQKISGKSLMTIMTIGDYLEMTDTENNPYQRNKLGVKQYTKLVADLLDDTVMPPISVVYCGTKEEILNGLDENKKFIILDGLQRTNCIMHCIERLRRNEGGRITTEQEFLKKKIYVEIWEELDLKTILYKMVVLNTGQKKMDYAHQLDILNNSLKIELQKQDIQVITAKEKKDGHQSKDCFSLADITEGLVSYINGTPISGKKNAAEFLFERLNVGINTGEDSNILELIYSEETYDNLIWVLKDFNKLLDQKYDVNNPLKKYNVFLISFLASIGFAYKKNADNFSLKKRELEKLCKTGDDPLRLKAFTEYYNKFKTGIGEKRRKFVYEVFRDYFISKSDLNTLEWEDIYDRYF